MDKYIGHPIGAIMGEHLKDFVNGRAQRQRHVRCRWAVSILLTMSVLSLTEMGVFGVVSS
jgi:hypothetical protein